MPHGRSLLFRSIGSKSRADVPGLRTRWDAAHHQQLQESGGTGAVADWQYESAKLCGVEPRAYLRETTLRAVRNPGTVTLARDLKSPEAWEESGVDPVRPIPRERARTYRAPTGSTTKPRVHAAAEGK